MQQDHRIHWAQRTAVAGRRHGAQVFAKSLPANETEGSYPGSGKRESEKCL